MRTPFPAAILTGCLLLLLPSAEAGTLEAPEISDAEGDCEFAPGNEYMDIMAAWVSDETATDFLVNLAIPKWTDAVAPGAAFTVQFTHQGLQFGIVAAYAGGQGWYYGNARVDESGVGDITDTDGSFTPGEPSVLSVTFLKSHFPHADMNDDRLHTFSAGSVDLKPSLPFLIAGAEPPLPLLATALPCDDATGTAEYRFQVGDHASHGMPDQPAAGEGAAGNATADAPVAEEPLAAQSAPEQGISAPAAPLVALALAGAAWARRARRHQ